MSVPSSASKKAFTLIELSIVLVILGLLVGGIIVGRSLVIAANTRAQVAQIQQFTAAVQSFKSKYKFLPGDISDPTATKFGFAPRGTLRGQGDGNGIIEGGNQTYNNYDYGLYQGEGETAMFWVDLSHAQLIAENFNLASSASMPVPAVHNDTINLWMPAAKLKSNYVSVFSDKGNNFFSVAIPFDNVQPSRTDYGIIAAWGAMYNNPGMTVKQAYAIDSKVDDGLPQSGDVLAIMIQDLHAPFWPAGGPNGTAGAAPGSAVAGDLTTCYDNNNSASNPMVYSLTQQNSAAVNCALSFRF